MNEKTRNFIEEMKKQTMQKFAKETIILKASDTPESKV